jgi:cobalt-zinc-cadmium resistance protein CzcA
MGPVATGLSEIYMWSVDYAPRGSEKPAPDGKPGWQRNGDYLTPEGQRLRTSERTAYSHRD